MIWAQDADAAAETTEIDATFYFDTIFYTRFFNMKPSENAVFAAVILFVAASGLAFYGYELAREDAHRGEAAASTASTVRETTTSSTSTTTSTSTTSTSSAPTSTTEPEETSTTLEAATTSTVQTTTTTLKPYDRFERFRGKGHRVVYMDVKYLCPSCVPVVVATVSREPGVLSKSLSFKQDVSWVVYNPNTVKLERILELAGAGGDAEIINDTGI
jgi:hypothetical protein